MKLQQLLEALKPSQYRNLVKGWDKSKYADLFGGKYRIYIPLGEKSKDIRPNPEVEAFVKHAGYEIEDYLTGIASKDNGKRKIRIGKLLANEPELKKMFDNDSSRNSSQSEYVVVISRHPYDIAGMTSGRAWEDESCMNLDSGSDRRYVPLDIKEGTFVAYLIKNTDKNIESPSARVLIKPFINLDGSGEVAFGVETKVYGKPSPEFQQTVVDWVDSINKKKKLNGIFEFNQKLYNDSLKGKKIKVFGDNPSEQEQLKAVSRQGISIQNFKNPSEQVQLAALKQDIDAIQYITNPSEAVQLEAVKQNEFAINFIDYPTEQVQLAAIKENPLVFKYIKKPTEAVKKYYEEHSKG